MLFLRKSVIILVFVSLLGLTIALNCDGEPSSNEGKLLKKLFCYNYDKTERPVKNHSAAVNVKINVHVQNYDLDERKSTLTTFVWLGISWKDEYLSWDPMEYGIDMLTVESSEIWTPTIIPFNNHKSTEEACMKDHCKVNKLGKVLCLPACQYEAFCASNTANWPFDSQNCSMSLGTWVEDVEKIKINETSQITTYYIEVSHSEWKMVSANARHFLYDNDTYPTVEYTFLLERHIAIYGAILTPGFIMAILNMGILWMSCVSSERLYILCGTCLGHFSYLQYLYWRVPYHGVAVPKLLIFFRDSLLLNVALLAFTIMLRQMCLSTGNSSSVFDKLAIKVASTNVGSILLQSERVGNASKEENDHHAEPNADGDTVNLVVEATEAKIDDKPNTNCNRQILVATFLDRILFVCSLFSYILMIFNLLPSEN
ncbi:neuronal acetylcholine receptor subunit beta-3-like isoform X2 [Anopheles aquasalis]|uniref:neuronal acetylcholine receptor subunit beta-3-like isoform X2 n=1 Tax=Anopheles aquasalis TaxID=42839 RepID=UPI00215B2276|nr:neuronal acetylcholine receptor subunit beta-3-like isoform X2 [Anopheles aquasalis]